MKKRKAVKKLRILFAVITGVGLAVWLFLSRNPVLGGSATAKQQADYAARTLWFSWVLKTHRHLVFESGDTGWGKPWI